MIWSGSSPETKVSEHTTLAMNPVAMWGAVLGHAAVSATTLDAAAIVTMVNPRFCMLVSGRLMSRHQMTHHRGGGSPGSKIARAKLQADWPILKFIYGINR